MSPTQRYDEQQQRRGALIELMQHPDGPRLTPPVPTYDGDPGRFERYRYLPMAYVAHQKVEP